MDIPRWAARITDPMQVSSLMLVKPRRSPGGRGPGMSKDTDTVFPEDLQPPSGGAGTGSRLVIPNREFRQSTEAGAGDKPQSNLDYELIRLIGEGEMSVVYAARQTSVDRVVAIKLIKADRAQDQQARAAFLSEAVVVGELDHPNIAPVHEVGADDGQALFYAMKLVTGTSWDRVIAKNTVSENLHILTEVADAVAFAHSRGIIHRDLKPENVMLGEFGEVLVMNWNLAIFLPGTPKAASVEHHSGLAYTPSYAAPELVNGPVAAIGVWSDIYLLGGMLFEIVTGSPPHVGATASECCIAASKNVVTPTDRRGELLDIALMSMATNPLYRYRSVKEFQEAVRAYESSSNSLALAARAADLLQQARATDDYQNFAHSVFAYQEAINLWDGNTAARTGLADAQTAYAESALRRGDCQIGVTVLDPKNPDQASLLRKLKQKLRERNHRRARLRWVLATASLLAMAVCFGGGWAAFQAVQPANSTGSGEAALAAEISLLKAENDLFKGAQQKSESAQ